MIENVRYGNQDKAKAKFEFDIDLLDRAAIHFEHTKEIKPPEYFLDLDLQWEAQVMKMHNYRASFAPKTKS